MLKILGKEGRGAGKKEGGAMRGPEETYFSCALQCLEKKGGGAKREGLSPSPGLLNGPHPSAKTSERPALKEGICFGFFRGGMLSVSPGL